MKRVLSLINNVGIASVFAGLLLATSSFSFDPAAGAQLVDNNSQKKVQKVTVVVNKDGKETKIDTTFNLVDEKMIQVKVDSVLNKMDVEGIGSGNSDIIIHRVGKRLNCTVKGGGNSPEDGQFDILIQNSDSGKTNQVRKIIHVNGYKNKLSTDDFEDEDLLPPPPPMPPCSSMMFQQHFGGDPFTFDPKDESIISYSKKDIGRGLEKIIIIRKKQIEPKPMKVEDLKPEIHDDSKK